MRMKTNKFFVYLFIFFLLCTTGCKSRSEVEMTAEKYLEGYYSYDFESIYDICSDSTLKAVKDIESRVRGLVDLSQIAVPEVVVHEYYLQGDTAYCRYTLKQDKDDINAMSENLMLIKKDDKWLVEYKFY